MINRRLVAPPPASKTEIFVCCRESRISTTSHLSRRVLFYKQVDHTESWRQIRASLLRERRCLFLRQKARVETGGVETGGVGVVVVGVLITAV